VGSWQGVGRGRRVDGVAGRGGRLRRTPRILPHPLGAFPQAGGTNFSVFSRHAGRLDLQLYDTVDAAEPARVIPLPRQGHRSGDYWHVFVPGVATGQLYAWRAHGPHDPDRGLRFDAGKVLLDPYGRAIALPAGYSRAAACEPGRNDAWAAKSVVASDHGYDWQGDAPAAAPVRRHRHLRASCARLHAAPELRRGRGPARHLRRAGGEDPVPGGPGRHRGGVDAGIRLRRAGCAAGSHQLLGLLAVLVLRAAPRPTAARRRRWRCWTNSATWSRPCTAPGWK
jgi:hypothetical protein